MEGMRRRNSGPAVHTGREATCPAVPRAVQQREQADQLSGEARGRVSVWNRQKLGLPPPPDAPELPHVPQEGGDPLCDDTAGVVLVLCASCPVGPGLGKGLLEPSQGVLGSYTGALCCLEGKSFYYPLPGTSPIAHPPGKVSPGCWLHSRASSAHRASSCSPLPTSQKSGCQPNRQKQPVPGLHL